MPEGSARRRNTHRHQHNTCRRRLYQCAHLFSWRESCGRQSHSLRHSQRSFCNSNSRDTPMMLAEPVNKARHATVMIIMQGSRVEDGHEERFDWRRRQWLGARRVSWTYAATNASSGACSEKPAKFFFKPAQPFHYWPAVAPIWRKCATWHLM